MSTVSFEREVLSREQSAEFLGVSLRYLDDLVRKGLVPSHKRGSRRFFIRSELLDWVRQAEAA